MSSDVSLKLQTVLWWITSIAASVLCCSVLFVLFASYLVDIKSSISDNDVRLNAIEEREDRILSEIENMHKHITPAAALPGTATPVSAPTGEAPAAVPPTETPSNVSPTANPTTPAEIIAPSVPAASTPKAPAQ